MFALFVTLMDGLIVSREFKMLFIFDMESIVVTIGFSGWLKYISMEIIGYAFVKIYLDMA